MSGSTGWEPAGRGPSGTGATSTLHRGKPSSRSCRGWWCEKDVQGVAESRSRWSRTVWHWRHRRHVQYFIDGKPLDHGAPMATFIDQGLPSSPVLDDLFLRNRPSGRLLGRGERSWSRDSRWRSCWTRRTGASWCERPRGTGATGATSSYFIDGKPLAHGPTNDDVHHPGLPSVPSSTTCSSGTALQVVSSAGASVAWSRDSRRRSCWTRRTGASSCPQRPGEPPQAAGTGPRPHSL